MVILLFIYLIGLGHRKCLGAKLAMSQIKFFLVRLLQNYAIDRVTNRKSSNDAATALKTDSTARKLADTIETKDILFNGPIKPVHVSIQPRDSTPKFTS